MQNKKETRGSANFSANDQRFVKKPNNRKQPPNKNPPSLNRKCSLSHGKPSTSNDISTPTLEASEVCRRREEETIQNASISLANDQRSVRKRNNRKQPSDKNPPSPNQRTLILGMPSTSNDISTPTLEATEVCRRPEEETIQNASILLANDQRSVGKRNNRKQPSDKNPPSPKQRTLILGMPSTSNDISTPTLEASEVCKRPEEETIQNASISLANDQRSVRKRNNRKQPCDKNPPSPNQRTLILGMPSTSNDISTPTLEATEVCRRPEEETIQNASILLANDQRSVGKRNNRKQPSDKNPPSPKQRTLILGMPSTSNDISTPTLEASEVCKRPEEETIQNASISLANDQRSVRKRNNRKQPCDKNPPSPNQRTLILGMPSTSNDISTPTLEASEVCRRPEEETIQNASISLANDKRSVRKRNNRKQPSDKNPPSPKQRTLILGMPSTSNDISTPTLEASEVCKRPEEETIQNASISLANDQRSVRKRNNRKQPSDKNPPSPNQRTLILGMPSTSNDISTPKLEASEVCRRPEEETIQNASISSVNDQRLVEKSRKPCHNDQSSFHHDPSLHHRELSPILPTWDEIDKLPEEGTLWSENFTFETDPRFYEYYIIKGLSHENPPLFSRQPSSSHRGALPPKLVVEADDVDLLPVEKNTLERKLFVSRRSTEPSQPNDVAVKPASKFPEDEWAIRVQCCQWHLKSFQSSNDKLGPSCASSNLWLGTESDPNEPIQTPLALETITEKPKCVEEMEPLPDEPVVSDFLRPLRESTASQLHRNILDSTLSPLAPPFIPMGMRIDEGYDGCSDDQTAERQGEQTGATVPDDECAENNQELRAALLFHNDHRNIDLQISRNTWDDSGSEISFMAHFLPNMADLDCSDTSQDLSPEPSRDALNGSETEDFTVWYDWRNKFTKSSPDDILPTPSRCTLEEVDPPSPRSTPERVYKIPSRDTRVRISNKRVRSDIQTENRSRLNDVTIHPRRRSVIRRCLKTIYPRRNRVGITTKPNNHAQMNKSSIAASRRQTMRSRIPLRHQYMEATSRNINMDARQIRSDHVNMSNSDSHGISSNEENTNKESINNCGWLGRITNRSYLLQLLRSLHIAPQDIHEEGEETGQNEQAPKESGYSTQTIRPHGSQVEDKPRNDSFPRTFSHGDSQNNSAETSINKKKRGPKRRRKMNKWTLKRRMPQKPFAFVREEQEYSVRPQVGMIGTV
ncbi:hypothetical protein GE061_000873 [Apolygus lucorum]|uniref:Uncharacterized protein n=1 Tax=Apolygus lucorum TaxID=248454 RepID=A0A8S9Y5I0_APOLU|nr:hypothetical protein GE061_000873 [Apolygus lucorum]